MARIIGLDIGSSAVRAVEVHPRGRHPKVIRTGRVSLPPGAVEGGQVREPAQVSQALRKLWHEQKFSTKAVRLGVGSGSVLVRQVELEWMPPQDLRKAMRYLVGDLLPVPVDEANIDHVLLEEVERPADRAGGTPRRHVRVLLVATARTGVDDVVRCVRAAGLRPVTADLSPLALIRAATRLGATGAETEALVDVGADKVAVAVHTRGRPHFVRVIPGLGGDSLTRALVDLGGEDPATAEQLKHGGDAGTALSPDSRRHLLTASQRIIDEIRDTLSFHVTSDPDHPPLQVRLTGQGGMAPGFSDQCSATLGLPVHYLHADGAATRRSRGHDEADLSVALGLCLGATA